MAWTFPKWRFHPTREACIVRDQEEFDSRTPSSEGWVNHPSEFVPVVADLPETPTPEPVAPAELESPEKHKPRGIPFRKKVQP